MTMDDDKPMEDYLLSPRAPLLFGKGQPFGGSDQVSTQAFPLPSTLAGALRTALGEYEGWDYQQEDTRTKLRSRAVHSPLLVRELPDGSALSVLLARPADAFYGVTGSREHVLRVQPVARIGDSQGGTDLDEDEHPGGLLLPDVDLQGEDIEEADGGPVFWELPWILEWLRHPGLPPDFEDLRQLQRLGPGNLPVETRTHVGIDATTQTGIPNILFQTTGLDFGPGRTDEYRQFGLLVRSSIQLENTFRTVGGRSRLAHIRQASGVWPACPRVLREALGQHRGVRLILATPAHFDNGWLPGWLTRTEDGSFQGIPPGLSDCGFKLVLRSVALGDWIAGSSLDLVTRRRSAVRRLVPAGSVYWFEILGEGDTSRFADLWLTSVSDQLQSRLDGFGLALPGVWNPPSISSIEEHHS